MCIYYDTILICNCNCNLFRIQSDPDTGWKIKFHKPLAIECVLKS
jgi:hypothetical protein